MRMADGGWRMADGGLHLTLEEYDEVCRDISTSISRYTGSHAMPNHSNAKRTPHIDSQGTDCKGTD